MGSRCWFCPLENVVTQERRELTDKPPEMGKRGRETETTEKRRTMLMPNEMKGVQLKAVVGRAKSRKKKLRSSETGEKEVTVAANGTSSVLCKTKMKFIMDSPDFQQEENKSTI